MQKNTKELISSAFLKLLSEKPFDKITIKDIVVECNINRNTFYYYYSDVYDLLEEIFKKEMYDIIDTHKETGGWMEGFLKVAHTAYSHKKIINNICNSRSYDYFISYMFRACNHIVVDVVQYAAKDKDVPMEDIEFIATFYEHGLVGTISEWFKSGMKTEPIELVGQLWLVVDNIKYSLRKSEKRKKGIGRMTVLFEDTEIIVCLKPAGINSQGGNSDMVARLNSYFSENSSNAVAYPVHRLDRETAGIMVFAKNAKSAAELSKQVSDSK